MLEIPSRYGLPVGRTEHGWAIRPHARNSLRPCASRAMFPDVVGTRDEVFYDALVLAVLATSETTPSPDTPTFTRSNLLNWQRPNGEINGPASCAAPQSLPNDPLQPARRGRRCRSGRIGHRGRTQSKWNFTHCFGSVRRRRPKLAQPLRTTTSAHCA